MDDSKFEINVLQAFHGDCIHLRFNSEGKWYNIVIDSGPAFHETGFKNLLNWINDMEEQVDLLCFTHMDDDHILAAKNYFRDSEKKTDFIKQIWINVPEDEIESAQSATLSSVCTTSANKASKLYGCIYSRGIPHTTKILRGQTIYFGDVLVQAVLPTQARREEYFAEWHKQKTKDKCTSANSLDDKPANGGSIALFVWVMGKRMLFSGDAFAEDLTEVAEMWAGDGFDLIKLPHHGSNGNITDEMLKAMKCRCFVISADGKRDRPTQATIDLLASYGRTNGTVTLYGNNPWKLEERDGIAIKTLAAEAVLISDGITLRTEQYNARKR